MLDDESILTAMRVARMKQVMDDTLASLITLLEPLKAVPGVLRVQGIFRLALAIRRGPDGT